MFEGFKDLVEAKKGYEKKAKAEGERVVREALREFFAAFPEVAAIRWTQYTPYFNDGDACVFGVNEPCVKLMTRDADEDLQEDDEVDDGLINSYDIKDANLKRALNELYRQMSTIEDALKYAFGDHAEITATRRGLTIDSYDHD
jgi:hypothetical protein